ncbi:hypothetical protein KL918_003738 [Ogataea parapolymorpha]|uniref:Uncharacterized protein n=1 Tax=Ogataea parapolymorpha (strain ATCC 26012 / BCRC 20466 / JCM 22074 / NRRL Y-7560 / DL-1) TaxID=871575 RepID=W1QK20_OGAPD|nr:hypothetical protein HPODL_04948 [Ogataea parapolymorpha DL-1]ESX02193.1 hypothetical protein HPODL_04948 [Ogataea parapolymorpha DL-1]KAG7866273.1 hypothetical protein KL918_003738 [Ogataea parapolymorpha]KAG7872901.1 hypothetical protein KL916_002631 [Ogataea parapolymorpha]
MDMEAEFEDFQKKNTPSLIGSSVRNSSTPSGDLDKDEPESIILDRARSSSRPVIKSNPSTSHIGFVSVEELKAEGGLLNDEEGEVLDEILDEEGHLKKDALQLKERLKTEEEGISSYIQSPGSEVSSEPVREKEHLVFGGDAGNFVAPAAAKSSHLTDFKYDSPSREPPKPEEKDRDLIEPGKLTTVDDILQRINQGSRELTEESENPPKPEAKVRQDKMPELFGYSNEVDQLLTAPASRREGSSSRLMRERQRSRSRPADSSGSPFREGIGMYRPHLAKGDSYHSGISNDEYSQGSVSSDAPVERKPRHDPGSVRLSSSSSLNYLRSISRSRSRAANDKDAIGKDRGIDQNELKEEGVLMHDGDFSQLPDYEDAITNALNIVENTKSVKDGSKVGRHKENIVSDLHNSLNSRDLGELNEADEDHDILKEKKNELKSVNKGVKGDSIPPDEHVNSDSKTAASQDLNAEEVDTKSSDSVQKLSDESRDEAKQTDTSEEKLPGQPDIVESLDEERQESTHSVETKSDETEDKDVHSEAATRPNLAETNIDNAPSQDHVNADDDLPTKTSADETILEQPKESLDSLTTKLESSTLAEAPEKPTANIEGTGEVSIEKEAPIQQDTPIKDEVKAIEPIKEKDAPVRDTQAKKSVSNSFDDDDDIEELLRAVEKEQPAQSSTSTANKGSVYVPKGTKMTFEDEPVFIYTSLAGGFQIATRTNRLQTILTANRVKFGFKDLGTDEQAKKVWRRYSEGKTLPGIVRGKDDFIGNWEDVEEANENYAVRSLIYETY